MENLFETVGTMKVSQLLADASGAVREAIVLAPGNGNVTRGTVLIQDADGFYAPAASADIAPTALMAIADGDVETGTVATGVGLTLAAYKKGTFLARHVKLKADAALTAANKAVLSNVGLMLKESISESGEYNVFDAEKA